MSRQSTDGLYIELGYLTPEEYYAYVAEAEARLGYYYIEAGYIDADYYDDSPGGAFSISCELTELIGEVKEFNASLTVTATQDASVGAQRQGDADLASAVSTSTAAVKQTDVQSSMSISAAQSSTAGAIRNANANITGAFSATLTAIGYKNMIAILDTSANLSTDAVLTADANVTLSNIVNISLQSDITRTTTATFTTAFTQADTTADITRETASTMSAVFATSASLDGTIDGQARLGYYYIEAGYIDPNYYDDTQGARITLSCAASKVKDLNAELDCAFTISNTSNSFGTSGSEPNVIYAGNAELAFTASQTATIAKINSGEATLTANASNSALVGVIKQGSVSITSAFTPILTASAIRFTDALLDSAFNIQANTVKTAQGTSAIASNAAITVETSRTRQFDTVLSSSFDATIDAARSRAADSTLSTAASLSAGVDSVRDAVAALNSTANATVSISKLPGSGAAISANTSLSADANRITDTTANISSAATLNADVDAFTYIEASAALESAAAIETTGYITNKRPRPYTVYGATINTSNKRFGTGSIYAGNSDYAEIAASTDWKSWKTIDFWYRPQLVSNFYHIIMSHGLESTSTDDLFFVYAEETATKYRIRVVVRIGGVSKTYSSDLITNSGFKHIRITRDTNGINMWVDGVKDTPVSNTTTNSQYPNIDEPFRIGYKGYLSGFSYKGFVDELYISESILTSSGTSSFTVPTDRYRLSSTEQNNAILLSHYDGDFVDDIGVWTQGSAVLTSAFTPSITVKATKITDININSAFTLAATVEALAAVTAILDTQSTLAASVGRIQQGDANLSGAATFNLTVDYLVINDAYLSSAFSLTADVDKIKNAQANLDAEGTLTATALSTFSITQTLPITSSLTADVKRIFSGKTWLPRRSVWIFEGDDTNDVISDVGVTSTGLAVYDGGPGQTGYGAPLIWTGASESNAGQASFSNVRKYAVIERTTGEYNTNIDTNDFALDLYVNPYGDTTRFNTLIKFHNSANDFTFGYTYDKDWGIDDQERFNFVIQENGSDAYVYNYVMSTGSSPHFETYGGWFYFRIQRVNGNLTVKMRDISATSNTTNIVSVSNYNVDFNSGYTIFESNSHTIPTRIDLIALQIGSDEYPVNVSNAQPKIQEWYTEWTIGGAVLDVTSNLSTDYLRVLFGESNLDSNTTIAATLDRFRFADANFNVTASIQTTAETTLFGQSNLQSTVTMSCSAVKTTDVTSTQDITATQNANGARIRFAASDLSTQATLDLAYGEIIRPATANLSSNVSISVDNDRIRDNQISTDAIASALTAAAKVGDFLVAMDNKAQLTASAVKTADQPINLSSNAALETTPWSVQTGSASISATATLNADVEKLKRVEIALEAAFTADTTAVKTTNTSSTQTAAFTAVINPYRVRYNEITLNTTATLNSQPQLIIYGAAQLSSEFIPVFNLQKIVRITANLEALNAVLTAGRVIHIDEFYQLLVKQETRTIKVLEETRGLVVEEETRVEII